MKSIKEEISSVLSLFPISRNYHLSNSPHKVGWKLDTYWRSGLPTRVARYFAPPLRKFNIVASPTSIWWHCAKGRTDGLMHANMLFYGFLRFVYGVGSTCSRLASRPVQFLVPFSQLNNERTEYTRAPLEEYIRERAHWTAAVGFRCSSRNWPKHSI